MKEKCVVLNKSFIDEFDIPLQEGAVDDFYTVSEIKQEVEKRIARLAALDAEYAISPESIIRYEIVSGGRSMAEVVPVDTHKYVFRIAKQTAVKRNEKYLDTIIYHELCHILQVDTLLNMGYIHFDEEGFLSYYTKHKALVWTLYDKDEGHTSLWQSYVDSTNDAFMVNPPISRYFTVTEDISDAFLESTFKQEPEKARVKNQVFTDDFSYLFKDESGNKEN
jgi:hypothetical protein